MKYFLDTEFIEGFNKPVFGKRRHHIDLISIAIVAEDGRHYYAISNEYSYEDASEWVREKVILPLYLETVHGDARNRLDVTNFHKEFGRPNSQIASEITAFIYPIEQIANHYYVSTGDHPDIVGTDKLTISDKSGRLTFSIFDKELEPELEAFTPEIYAYYADYDWVLFCSLFGTMMDLPKNFPMYCRDLKQMLDEVVIKLGNNDFFETFHIDEPVTFKKKLEMLKTNPNYPTQDNEHSALDDARWNYKLFNFIKRFV
jgi:hypothetical protein